MKEARSALVVNVAYSFFCAGVRRYLTGDSIQCSSAGSVQPGGVVKLR
jgi:hypothetical protein